MKRLALVPAVLLALVLVAAVAPTAAAQPNPFWFDLKASVCGTDAYYQLHPTAELRLYLQVDDNTHPGAPLFNFALPNNPGMQNFVMPAIRGYVFLPGGWRMVNYRLKVIDNALPGQPVISSQGPINIQNYGWQQWYFRMSTRCPVPVAWKSGDDVEPAASWGTLKGTYR